MPALAPSTSDVKSPLTFQRAPGSRVSAGAAGAKLATPIAVSLQVFSQKKKHRNSTGITPAPCHDPSCSLSSPGAALRADAGPAAMAQGVSAGTNRFGVARFCFCSLPCSWGRQRAGAPCCTTPPGLASISAPASPGSPEPSPSCQISSLMLLSVSAQLAAPSPPRGCLRLLQPLLGALDPALAWGWDVLECTQRCC